MKIYGKIFKVTFILYVLMLFVSPYVTARLWADICLIFFILSLVYQLLFVLFLRKKEDIKIIKAICMYFVYAISSVGIYILCEYVNMWFNGYTPSDFVGNSYGTTYYGFDAIKNADWENLIFIPYLIFNIIVLIIYNLSRLLRKDKSYK